MEYTEKEKKTIENIKDEFHINGLGARYTELKSEDLEILLSLLEKQQKEIDCLKNHVHYIKCKNCNKEIRTKRSDTKYCSECSKKVSNKNYINNLSEEQKEKRRMKARETMRKIRAGR